jgi:hypothetical protein
MRARYAGIEATLEKEVYEIGDSEPEALSRHPELPDFVLVPTEFPHLGKFEFHEFFYIINLDREVLTMNYTIHWKLGDIPREDELWLRAIVDSTNRRYHTVSLKICPEKHLASLALDLAEPNWEIETGDKYGSRLVSPRTSIVKTGEVFLTHVLVHTIFQYREEILSMGGEWSPESFPFRELVFALVSIASGQAKYYSFPAGLCRSPGCEMWQRCEEKKHLANWPGGIGEEWAGDSAPLLEFGSHFHLPGDPPGASPVTTMYWVDDVLVSLALVVDGDAIMKAVAWGMEQSRTHFQLTVLSIFEVAFAEVSCDMGGKTFVIFTHTVSLSPLSAKDCLSTHPRERPEIEAGDQFQIPCSERIGLWKNDGSVEGLQLRFPGLCALVNFFEVAATRQTTYTSSTTGILPMEIYDIIVEFVDYDTWKTCLKVSSGIRASCLRKYRIDDRARIVGGPFVCKRKRGGYKQRQLAFDMENMETGKILQMSLVGSDPKESFNWMPVIGSDRKAIMLDVNIDFRAVDPDGKDERSSDSESEQTS